MKSSTKVGKSCKNRAKTTAAKEAQAAAWLHFHLAHLSAVFNFPFTWRLVLCTIYKKTIWPLALKAAIDFSNCSKAPKLALHSPLPLSFALTPATPLKLRCLSWLLRETLKQHERILAVAAKLTDGWDRRGLKGSLWLGWVMRLVPGNLVMISFPFALRARLLSFQFNDNNQPCERLCLLARRWWNISQSKLLWKQREIRVMQTKVVSWLIAVWRWLMECWHSSINIKHIRNGAKFGLRYSAEICFLINFGVSIKK